MVYQADHLTGGEDVLASEAEDGEIRCNLGDSVTGIGISAATTTWGVDGFISRPNDPNDDGAARAIYVQDGHQKRIIAMADRRYDEKVGSLEPGDRAIVSNSEARLFLKRLRDAITLYTANDTDSGSAMMVALDGKDGQMLLTVSGTFIKITKDEIVLGVNGGASITLSQNGVTITGQAFTCATSQGTLGMLPGLSLIHI